jgi:hypothetical protein
MTDAPNPLRSAYSGAPESPAHSPSEETAHSARLELIGSIAGNLLIGDGDPDALVRDAFERLSEHLGLEVYVNYLIDEEHQGLRLQACAGIDDEAVERLRWLDFGQAVCGTVARDGRRRVVEHVLDSEEPITEFIRSIGIRAYACQALVTSGRTIGTLSFGTRRRDVFEPAQNLLAHVNVILNVLQGGIVGEAFKKAFDFLLGRKHGGVSLCLSVLPDSAKR